MRFMFSLIVSAMCSQPRRLVISVGSVFQTVWSCSQIRAITRLAFRSESAPSTATWYVPRLADKGCWPVSSRSRFSAMLAMSASKDWANDATPSSSNFWVMESKSTPKSDRRVSWACASSRLVSTEETKFPCSRTACSVAGGKVLTVSGPIRLST